MDVIDEEMLGVSLSRYITNLFVNKLKEIALESFEIYTYDYVNEYLNSLALYFNQGEIAPFALGVISVKIPMNQSFSV